MLIEEEIIKKAEKYQKNSSRHRVIDAVDPDNDWALHIPVFSSPEEAKTFVNSFVKNLYENS